MVVCILCIVKGKSTLTVAGRDSVSFKTEVLRFVTYLINSSKRYYLNKKNYGFKGKENRDNTIEKTDNTNLSTPLGLPELANL